MESRAKVAGHPLHPMLITFPLGLLPTAFLFDLIALASGSRVWSLVAFYMMGAGIVGALIAAVPGAIDWLAIPSRTRAKRIGTYHGVGNVVVLLLFATAWFLRRNVPEMPPTTSLVLAFLGIALALVTGWLGGELVDRLGVGVDDGANLDAPSSFSHEPASRPARP
ncbi:MAG TPA: DUF2231 domain-containing protein [Candidatus Binatia bacterium]|nr:DUF2231 domain-containing protein [Candidatus Binatia bacterium]